MASRGTLSNASLVSKRLRLVFDTAALRSKRIGGKRYLSEKAAQMMTSKQTGNAVQEDYGFGWSVGSGWAGHGGAESTNMEIDWQKGLIFIYMVQHAGYPNDGAKSHDAFKQAAIVQFSK